MAEHANGLPLSAQPNVGLPSRSGGRIVYPNATPDYFAEFAAQARRLGAGIVGGCCGATPAQIAALRAAVQEGRQPRVPLVAVERDVAPGPLRYMGRAVCRRSWRRASGSSVELDPPKGTNMEAMLAVASRLQASAAVDVVDLNDNPMARARLSALMAAVAIERAVGIETIPHVTPARRVRHGAPVAAPGAHAEGVRNILAVTGDPPHVGDYPGSSEVYTTSTRSASSPPARLNGGEDYSGKAIDAPTSFYVGVAVTRRPKSSTARSSASAARSKQARASP